jgi:hypothetical protein
VVATHNEGSAVGKQVGFWFYTGDWMKDPELRFCSIFARGMLIDLLCLMFEAKRPGELSRPDGSPRSDEEIVDSVAGSTRAEKLEALGELLVSGALKRDAETGVVYSSRLRRLFEETAAKKRAGKIGGQAKSRNRKQDPSKDGSKPHSTTVAEPLAEQLASNVAEQLADPLAKSWQKGGVSDSVSASDIDKNTHTLTEEGFNNSLEEKNASRRFTSVLEKAVEPIASWFRRWVEFQFQKTGQWMPEIQQDILLLELMQSANPEKVARDIELSIKVGAKNICDSSKDFRNQGPDDRSYGQRMGDSTGI